MPPVATKPEYEPIMGRTTADSDNSERVATLRLCEGCLVRHPANQFRRRRRGQDRRVNQCRLCHNLRERLRRTGIRNRATRREMAKAMTNLRSSTSEARVAAFCSEMVQLFGGAEGFLDAWKACIRLDLEKGGLSAFRHIAVLLKFMDHCKPRPTNYSAMSDEELMALAIKNGLMP